MENNTQLEAGQGTDAPNNPEANKTFSQDEVNAIVQQRLAREKEKAKPEQDAAYTAKMLELNQRELQLTVKEMLMERGMPKELSSIIKASDEKELKANIEILSNYIKKEEAPQVTGFKLGNPSGKEETTQGSSNSEYRKVMGLD